MQKKFKNILLTLSIGSIFTPIAFVSANCNGNPKKPDTPTPTPQTEITDQEFNDIVKKINQSDFDFKLKNVPGLDSLEKSKLYPTDIADNDQNIQLTIKNSAYQNKISLKMLKGNLPDGRRKANQTGKMQFVVEISAKGKQSVNKIIEMDGFLTNPYGADRSGKIDHNPTDSLKPNENKIKDYVTKLTQTQRFETDNEKYMGALKQQLHNQSLSSIRKDLSELTSAQLQKFNELAKKHNFDNYANAALKGFTLPTYDNNGKYEGMSLDEKPETAKGPSWVDVLGKSNPNKIDGLARTLPNDMYKKAAIQTYQVTIRNDDKDDPKKGNVTAGTMWLMDYQKKTDGTYPTKFYFGTNLHVADVLTQLTSSFSMLRLNKNAGIKSTFKLSDLDTKNFTRFYFAIEKAFSTNRGIKTVFDGRNFLTKKPSDYLGRQKDKFKDFEEFIDFAVFEIDFAELFSKTGENHNNASSAEELAKSITNDYASSDENHVKFKSESYLKNYNKIDVPLQSDKNKPFDTKYDQLYAVGYPSSLYDHFLRRYIDDHQISAAKWNYSLWLNSNYEYYDKLVTEEGSQPAFPEELLKRGDFLSYQIGYRSFINRPGVLDAFISAPKSGNDWYVSSDGKKYIAFGLEYMPKHYSPGGGASGSSVRNQNNELVGVYHVSNNIAKTGLAAAFRSEGYDYGTLFDNQYKLPQYDLIYGGGADQRNSYRQALKELYGENYQTALFNNGVGDNQIPEEFKFTGYVKDAE